MSDRQEFLVRFWGVRGSYPTPGPQTLRHGGNTACVEVRVAGLRLIFDAGSGIIQLGSNLLQQLNGAGKLDVALFITHAHGDHLLGFPFFSPLFDERTHLHLFGPQLAGQNVEQIVTSLMSPPYFPVDLRKLPSHRTFYTLSDGQSVVWHKGASILPQVNESKYVARKRKERLDDDVIVYTKFTKSHPLNGAVIYRIEYAGHCVVYATDVEWQQGCDPAFLRFIEGADLLIHDAQYTAHDYEQEKQGFGHSTVKMAVEAAHAANVHELILFHHEPTYDDNQLDAMEAEAQSLFPHARSACEGMEIDILAGMQDGARTSNGQ